MDPPDPGSRDAAGSLWGWAGAAPTGPIGFAAALEASRGLAAAAKQAAYEQSYADLVDRPEGLARTGVRLAAAVARIGADAELPAELGIALFAYRNAVFMARRRERDPFDSTLPGG